MTAVKRGRDLIERGREAGDDIAGAMSDVRDALDEYLARADGLLANLDRSPRRSLGLPLAIGVVGVAAGYLIGRRGSRPEQGPATTNGVGSPPAEPAMEVTTAVEVSRPQPADLDEIVPENGASAEPASGAKS